jgi:hypothetical protein
MIDDLQCCDRYDRWRVTFWPVDSDDDDGIRYLMKHLWVFVTFMADMMSVVH